MGKKRKSYCSRNGCSMINGAAPISAITCPVCGTVYNNGLNSPVTKLCPACKSCHTCKRIGKKYFKSDADILTNPGS